ncbi:MAG: restriction endonuclease [Cytophagales bacterium]|nr:restriction endonuclease [Cytophagales bacterium]
MFQFDEIPNGNLLTPRLSKWLNNEQNHDLDGLKDLVFDFIIENEEKRNPNIDFDEIPINAMNVAFNIVEDLIFKLEVNPINCERLKSYINGIHSYHAFDRLLTDFEDLLSIDEKISILKEGKKIFVPEITTNWDDVFNQCFSSLLVQGIITPDSKTMEGKIIKAMSIPWKMIVDILSSHWEYAFKIPPEKWEELIAGAFDQSGYDEVILTPRSGDHGRDVIASKRGIGSIRIVSSVKAYQPGHLVRYDDVRALLGVLNGDQKASKGIITTTTDFPSNLLNDPFIAPFVPYRLELMNGITLQKWFREISKNYSS